MTGRIIDLTAEEVIPGDVVLRNSGDEAFTVAKAMTTGAEGSRSTVLLSAKAMTAPMTLRPDTTLRVRREHDVRPAGPVSEVEQLRAAIQRVRDLHPKTEDPRHGCCAPPTLCDGHPPECRSPEHPLGGVPWPCATLRALDG